MWAKREQHERFCHAIPPLRLRSTFSGCYYIMVSIIHCWVVLGIASCCAGAIGRIL
eukprot:c43660_g1_i1 orf=68-235(+)